MSSQCPAAASPHRGLWWTCAVKGRSHPLQRQWLHRPCNPPSRASPCNKGRAALTGKEIATEDATASAVAAMTGATEVTAKPLALPAP